MQDQGDCLACMLRKMYGSTEHILFALDKVT